MSYPPPNGGLSHPQMNLSCPHCQTRLTVLSSQAGMVTTCPQCGGKFQVPIPMAAPGNSPFGGYAPQSPVQQFANKKIAAGICGILLGGLGVHKFILGFNNAGTIMLVVYIVGIFTGMCVFVPILASLAMTIIGLVEGIIYLTKSDEEFYQTYAIRKQEWF